MSKQVLGNALLGSFAGYVPAFVALTLSSILSIIGSGVIIYLVVSKKKMLSSIFHRIMLGLSLIDVISSTSYVLQPYVVPDTSGLPFALGNALSCSIAGLLNIYSYASWLYSGELSLYYYLTICLGWRDERVKKMLEPWVHLLPWVGINALGISSLVQGNLRMQTYTALCSADDTDSVTAAFMVILFVIPILAGIALTWKVYGSVRKLRVRQSIYEFRSSNSSTIPSENSRQTRAVGVQCVCYTAAAISSLVVMILFSIIGEMSGIGENTKYALVLISYTLSPLQGAINAFVFVRPTAARCKRANPDKSWWWAFWHVLSGRPANMTVQLPEPATSSIAKTASTCTSGQRDTLEDPGDA